MGKRKEKKLRDKYQVYVTLI